MYISKPMRTGSAFAAIAALVVEFDLADWNWHSEIDARWVTGVSPMRMPFKPRSLDRDRPLKRLNSSKPLDPAMRLALYGPVHGMNYPTLMDRLLGH